MASLPSSGPVTDPAAIKAEILLVIPCYREQGRLPQFLSTLLAAVESSSLAVQVQVVDDGSPSWEQAALLSQVEALRSTHPRLLPPLAYAHNKGKGHAIRFGWEHAVDQPWLAFVDADGAVPADEVVRVLERATMAGSLPSVTCGVRQRKAGPPVNRHLLRALGSRLFQTWVAALLRLPLHDTQCGLKVLPAPFYRNRRGAWREERYAFDLELLLAAQRDGFPVAVVPVRWTEQADTRLGPGAALRLFADAWRLRNLRGKRDVGQVLNGL